MRVRQRIVIREVGRGITQPCEDDGQSRCYCYTSFDGGAPDQFCGLRDRITRPRLIPSKGSLLSCQLTPSPPQKKKKRCGYIAVISFELSSFIFRTELAVVLQYNRETVPDEFEQYDSICGLSGQTEGIWNRTFTFTCLPIVLAGNQGELSWNCE